MSNAKMSRAEINLRGWLREYRMDSHFPDLSLAPPLRIETEMDKVFLREDGGEIASILARIRHAKRTLIRFTAGHGTSTFAQSVAKCGRDYSNGVYLFVEPFRKRNLLGGDVDGREQPGAAHVLSEGLLDALLEKNFEDLLYNGRPLYFDILNVSDSTDLNYYRNCKLVGDEPPDYREWFNSTASQLAPKFLATVERLHSEANMSTIVCFDLPHSADDDLIGEVVRSMKWVEENKRVGYPGMALLEAYFVSHEVANAITSVWSADYQEITIEPYNRGEIFLILAKRYNPIQLGRSVPLNTILNESFVSSAYGSGEPLVDILKKMRVLLQDACDRPRDQITPTLAPPAR